MRILITGGRGQLGRSLQKALIDHEVLAYGHRELDVADEPLVKDVIAEVRPEVVIHAAAWTDTVGCESDPERAHRVNAAGTGNVAAACAQAGAAILYVSTNEVFDGGKKEPYVEEDQANPINAYGASKWKGECYLREAAERCYIVRTSWLYGLGRQSFPEKIIQAAQERGALKVVTDEVASPTWTDDLAQGIAKLIEQPAWGTYHLSNGGHCSRFEWAREVLALAGLGRVQLEGTTQEAFGLPYRKPVFSALVNVHAGRRGIVLRPWREALRAYFKEREVVSSTPSK